MLHRFHWKPHEFYELPPPEQAVIIASIQVKLEDDMKAEREAKLKAKK